MVRWMRRGRNRILARIIPLGRREVPSHARLMYMSIHARIRTSWVACRVHSRMGWELKGRSVSVSGVVSGGVSRMSVYISLFVLEHLDWGGAGAADGAVVSLDGFAERFVPAAVEEEEGGAEEDEDGGDGDTCDCAGAKAA